MKKSPLVKMSFSLFCVGFLFFQANKASAQLPLSDLYNKAEFQEVIQQSYNWEDSEKQLYETIISQPRFSLSEGETFNIDNPDHLRVLKDRLEILKTERTFARGGDIGPVGIQPPNPCDNYFPYNPQSNFNKVNITYQRAGVEPFCNNGVCPDVFSINTYRACNNQSKVIMYATEFGTIGFGTNTPESYYHFKIPNFQIGDNTTVQFKIDNTTNNESLTFSKANQQLFKINKDGKVYAREFEISLVNPFPDYVFEKDYKLMKLDELEMFIAKNKHLPNIKPAVEYEKEGVVNVGELQIKLLEKVEELTLYTIELQKQIALQQAQIDELKKANQQ